MQINYNAETKDGPVLEIYSVEFNEFSTLRKLSHALERNDEAICANKCIQITGGSLELISLSLTDFGDHIIVDRDTYKIVLLKREWHIFSGLLDPFSVPQPSGSFQWMTGRNAMYLRTDDDSSVVVSFDDNPHF